MKSFFKCGHYYIKKTFEVIFCFPPNFVKNKEISVCKNILFSLKNNNDKTRSYFCSAKHIILQSTIQPSSIVVYNPVWLEYHRAMYNELIVCYYMEGWLPSNIGVLFVGCCGPMELVLYRLLWKYVLWHVKLRKIFRHNNIWNGFCVKK